MDHGVGRELTDALLELAWWCPEERWRALESEVNRVVGAPEDRDREPGAEQRRGPGGTCWIHVAGPQPQMGRSATSTGVTWIQALA